MLLRRKKATRQPRQLSATNWHNGDFRSEHHSCASDHCESAIPPNTKVTAAVRATCPWLCLVMLTLAVLAGCQDGDPAAAPCNATNSCKYDGLCSGVVPNCFAASTDDCRMSSICRHSARCTNTEGKCVLGLDDCHAWDDCANPDYTCPTCPPTCYAYCRWDGLCTVVGGKCAAATDKDCAGSKICAVLGKCTAKSEKCVPGSDIDCRASSYCKAYGNCSLKNEVCLPGSLTDCAQSDLCQKPETCTFEDGGCCASAFRHPGGGCK